MTHGKWLVRLGLIGMLGLTACGEEAPQLTIDTQSVPEKAVYFVIHPVKGQPGVRRMSGSSFGLTRYRLGAVTALVGAEIVNDGNAAFLKTENSKVAETRLCVASKNREPGCPRFVFEMQIAPSAGKSQKSGARMMPIQPVLQAKQDILEGVQAFHCTITSKHQRCVPFDKTR